MARHQAAEFLPGEGAVAAQLLGDKRRPGHLRVLAEELYLLVTVPEDGERVPTMEPWRIDEVLRKEILKGDSTLQDLGTLYLAEVTAVLTEAATMTKAKPRYNNFVKRSSFPETFWDRSVKQLFNRVMHRLEKERSIWIRVVDALVVPSDGQ